MIPFLAFLASAILAWLLCFPVHRELIRRHLIDAPNERSSHTIPTPRGGGIAIVLVILTTLGLLSLIEQDVLSLSLLPCVLLLAVVSFRDDIKPLSARVRFLVQCSVTLLFLATLVLQKEGFSAVLKTPSGITAGLVLFAWVVGYANAFNFMDGINGISSMQALVTGTGTALVVALCDTSIDQHLVMLALAVAGAALGFLPHNFPKARMFMGDVGSAPLGFLLAALALWVLRDYGRIAFASVVLLHLNYVMDTGITLIRRISRGENWRQAHKEHFYQRLVRAGKSHSFVTISEFALQIVILGLALLFLFVGAVPRILIVLSVILIWAVYFAYAERVFQASQRRLFAGDSQPAGKDSFRPASTA